MQKISVYAPSSKLAFRDLNAINFFKNINNHFKVNLFLDKKVDKNLLKGFNKVIVNKSNKFRNKLYLVHHQLARVDYEKENFPGYVQNQTFGIGPLILNFIKLISLLRLFKLFDFFSKLILKYTSSIDNNFFAESKIFVAFGSAKDLLFDDLIRIAKSKKIKTILITTNWDNATTKPYIEKPDIVLTWGNQTAKLSNKIHKIISKPIGTPRYEFYKNLSLTKSKCLKKLKLKKRNHYILYIGSSFPFAEDVVISKMCKYIETKGLKRIKIIYRPHPHAWVNFYKEFNKKKWKKKIIIDPTLNKFSKISLMQYPYLFQSVSAVISVWSTMIIEAALFNLPTLAIAFEDPKNKIFNWKINAKHQPHLGILRNNKWPIKCWDLKDFENKFELLIHDLKKKKSSNTKKIFKKVVYQDNRSFFQRLVHNIESHID